MRTRAPRYFTQKIGDETAAVAVRKATGRLFRFEKRPVPPPPRSRLLAFFRRHRRVIAPNAILYEFEEEAFKRFSHNNNKNVSVFVFFSLIHSYAKTRFPVHSPCSSNAHTRARVYIRSSFFFFAPVVSSFFFHRLFLSLCFYYTCPRKKKLFYT